MRVLVVKDDALPDDALPAGLLKKGHAVDWFTNGALADAEVAGISDDVAALNPGFPGGDGVQWCGAGRALYRPPASMAR